MNRALISVLSASLLLCTAGCRSVWVHPEATQEKFTHDQARCMYGMSSEEADRILLNPDEVPPSPRKGWKRCMTLLGWDTVTGARAGRQWDRR